MGASPFPASSPPSISTTTSFSTRFQADSFLVALRRCRKTALPCRLVHPFPVRASSGHTPGRENRKSWACAAVSVVQDVGEHFMVALSHVHSQHSVAGFLSSSGAPAVPICRFVMNGPPACRSDPFCRFAWHSPKY